MANNFTNNEYAFVWFDDTHYLATRNSSEIDWTSNVNYIYVYEDVVETKYDFKYAVKDEFVDNLAEYNDGNLWQLMLLRQTPSTSAEYIDLTGMVYGHAGSFAPFFVNKSIIQYLKNNAFLGGLLDFQALDSNGQLAVTHDFGTSFSRLFVPSTSISPDSASSIDGGSQFLVVLTIQRPNAMSYPDDWPYASHIQWTYENPTQYYAELRVTLCNKYSSLVDRRRQGSLYLDNYILTVNGDFHKMAADTPSQVNYVVLEFGACKKLIKGIGSFNYTQETSSTPNIIYLSKYLYDENGSHYKLNDYGSFATLHHNVIMSPKIHYWEISCDGTIYYPSIDNFNKVNGCKVLIVNKPLNEIDKYTLPSVVYFVVTQNALAYDWTSGGQSLSGWLPNATMVVDSEGHYDLTQLHNAFNLPIQEYECLDDYQCDEDGNLLI
jgi:hypothetical protein